MTTLYDLRSSLTGAALPLTLALFVGAGWSSDYPIRQVPSMVRLAERAGGARQSVTHRVSRPNCADDMVGNCEYLAIRAGAVGGSD